jgi:hypothetical protein
VLIKKYKCRYCSFQFRRAGNRDAHEKKSCKVRPNTVQGPTVQGSTRDRNEPTNDAGDMENFHERLPHVVPTVDVSGERREGQTVQGLTRDSYEPTDDAGDMDMDMEVENTPHTSTRDCYELVFTDDDADDMENFHERLPPVVPTVDVSGERREEGPTVQGSTRDRNELVFTDDDADDMENFHERLPPVVPTVDVSGERREEGPTVQGSTRDRYEPTDDAGDMENFHERLPPVVPTVDVSGERREEGPTVQGSTRDRYEPTDDAGDMDMDMEVENTPPDSAEQPNRPKRPSWPPKRPSAAVAANSPKQQKPSSEEQPGPSNPKRRSMDELAAMVDDDKYVPGSILF